MPGFSEYVDVESMVKLMRNTSPPVAGEWNADTWNQWKELASNLNAKADALVRATAGRSQEPTAKEFAGIAAEVDRLTTKLADEIAQSDGNGPADPGSAATLITAVNSMPGMLEKFDQERLQRS